MWIAEKHSEAKADETQSYRACETMIVPADGSANNGGYGYDGYRPGNPGYFPHQSEHRFLSRQQTSIDLSIMV